MYRAVVFLAVGLLVPFGASRCDRNGVVVDEPICDAGRLRDALEAARPGDVVRLGACTVTGSFTVPAGVVLQGEGEDRSGIGSEGRAPAVRLTPGDPPARLEGVTVRSDGHCGVLLLSGAGAVGLERVTVHASRGMALAGEDLDAVTLTDVALVGPVTPENELGVRPLVTAGDLATHGLVLVRVPSATLTDVSATGFALFGAMLVDDGTDWLRGGAPANRGVGLLVHGGSATLESLDLSGTLGATTVIPTYGGVFSAGADVQTTTLVVSAGADVGLLHDDARASHRGLAASDNHEAGVWVQDCPSFAIEGGEVQRNGLAGVVVLDTGSTVLAGLSAAETRTLPTVFRETGTVHVGAGIEVIRPVGPVTVSRSSAVRNEQVGLLFHLADAGTMDEVTIEEVSVAGEGSAYGAVAQNGIVDAGWDAGITRDAVTAANDAALGEPLDRAGLLDPTDTPSAADVAVSGLNGIIDPDPPF